VTTSPHIVNLSTDEHQFIGLCFNELLNGASSREMQNILGAQLGAATELASRLNLPVQGPFPPLNKADWRLIYDTINATIYALGEFELATLTGFSLPDAVNTNLKITARIWGTYGESHFK